MGAPGGVALLIIDALNPFDFEGAQDLLPGAERAAEAIERLAREAREIGAPVIYVKRQPRGMAVGSAGADRRRTHDEAAGRTVARRLAPQADDLFVIKPQVSGFYATNLPCCCRS